MSETKIEKLTPEQEALIPVYREKWRSIAFSTEPIDPQKAALAIKAAYAAISLSEPKILFCDSPYVAFKVILTQLASLVLIPPDSSLYNQLILALQSEFHPLSGLHLQLNCLLHGKLGYQLICLLQRHLTSSLWSQVVNQLNRQLLSQLSTQLLRGFFEHSLCPEELAWTCSQFDFCFSI